jgi:hypothetical protein
LSPTWIMGIRFQKMGREGDLLHEPTANSKRKKSD